MSGYLLVMPMAEKPPAGFVDTKMLAELSELEALYWGFGNPVPATSVELTGQNGVYAWWPVFETPPQDVVALLRGDYASPMRAGGRT